MLENKVVVITGASAGIGRATAIAFAKYKTRIALLARGLDGLKGAQNEIKELGTQALIIPTDVADYQQVEAAAEKIENTWGRIDIWVNNAMATIFCPVTKISSDDFKRATEVTYLGAVWGTLAALKRMQSRGEGVIIQVGSALCYRSIPLQAPYCGAKSALRGFTDSLRSELIHDQSNIHITMVHLSAFNTPQFDWGKTCMDKQPQPLPPIFQPEIAANAIVYAAQHRRREWWVGFPAIEAVIGTKLFPGWLDRKLARDAYGGQQTNELLPKERNDNLYRPVPGDPGAHGRFDKYSHTFSLQYWLSIHRRIIYTTVALVIALGSSVYLSY